MTRALYLDCRMGVAGDMMLAALLDAGADEKAVLAAIESLPIDGLRLVSTAVLKNGFACNAVRVEAPRQHVHRGLSDCVRLIEASSASDDAKGLAKRLFTLIGESEARVHGTTVDRVHFHEVGAIDSIVDILGVAVAFDSMDVETVISAPVPVGSGTISIAHGQCPVPAPATADLLIGIPLAASPVDGELTTPTGAAIVRELVDRFEPLPAITIESIGYGAGSRTYDHHPNLLRVFCGTLPPRVDTDEVLLLETNLDDISGEIIGHCRTRLLDAGALDVFSGSIDMKKDRPGVCLSVLARPEKREALETILFEETGTLGIRRTMMARTIRRRRRAVVETPFGRVEGKIAERPDGSLEFFPEFESCRQLATAHRRPIRDIYRAANTCFAPDVLQAREGETAPPPNHGDDLARSHDHSHDHDHDHSHDHDRG